MIPLWSLDQSTGPGFGLSHAFTDEDIHLPDTPKRRAVLVVDDDREIRGVLRDLLRDEGYQVFEAVNGAECLKRLEASEEPLVVLLDLMMPGVDGFEVCRRLAGDARLRDDHAVVLMSARRNLESADQTAVRATISKPFEVDDLLDLVEQLAAHPSPSGGGGNTQPGHGSAGD